jgi:hypothetical protein
MSLYTNKNKEFTITEGCPWYKEQQSYGPANVNWCEPTRCGWINEPANTWSNLGLILAGIFLMVKLNAQKNKIVRDFGWGIIVCGFFSFTYHASNNFFSQFFDFLGMFVMICIPLGVQFKRLFKQDPNSYYAFFWFLMFLSTCMFWFLVFWNIPVQQSVVVQVVLMFVLELFLGIREKRLKEFRYFWLCLVTMVGAQTVSQLDLKRVWCEPGNLILHGHAIWHVLSGIGMVFLGLHLKKMTNKG